MSKQHICKVKNESTISQDEVDHPHLLLALYKYAKHIDNCKGILAGDYMVMIQNHEKEQTHVGKIVNERNATLCMLFFDYLLISHIAGCTH